MDFVDSNILLYSVGRDEASSAKRNIARTLLSSENLVISVQVLGEFFTNAIRADKAALSDREAQLYSDAWTSTFQVASLATSTFRRALRIRSRFGLSYWDSLILASAKDSACTRLLTEDLNHGQDYDGVIAHNPFRTA